MPWPRGLALAVSAVLAAAVVDAAAAGTHGSGVRGRVLYGPTCPVQRVGESCTRPYQAWLTFRREPANKAVARVRSSADGSFSVPLPAGRYLLVPQNGRPFPHSSSQQITVHRDRYTTVTVMYDSGIR
jgi:hypothetical protein